MSIATEIERLQNAKADIKEAIENKGVSVGSGLLDTYANKINQIKTGITPSGTLNITKNGTYDVTTKEKAVVDVPSSSSGPIIEGSGKYEVRFVDYDGTLLKIQYVNEGGSATPPTTPTHDRLTFVEWNREFTNITHDLDVGATYKTKSGNTELYIKVTQETGRTITLNIYKKTASGAININWGDNKTSTNTATSTGVKVFTHTYSNYGNFIIQIATTAEYGLGGNTTSAIVVMGNNEDRTYKALVKCYCSENVTQFYNYCFFNNTELEECTYSDITIFGQYVFCGCKIKAIMIPSIVTQTGTRLATNCTDLEYFIMPSKTYTMSQPVTIGSKVKKFIYPENYNPSSVSYVSWYNGIEHIWHKKPTASSYTISSTAAQYSPLLTKFPIYNGLTKLSSTYCFAGTSIRKIAFPPTLTEIGNYAFYYDTNLTDVYMYPTTPPTLGGSTVFANTNTSCKVHVYPECLEAYQTATNWSSSTLKAKLVGDLEGEFEDGYCE